MQTTSINRCKIFLYILQKFAFDLMLLRRVSAGMLALSVHGQDGRVGRALSRETAAEWTT